MSVVSHPLPLDTKVVARIKRCSCRGGGFDERTGQIKKVINHVSGIWYYLDFGATVKFDQIDRIV